MKISEIELPSNKRFGLFFTAVFLLLSAYLFWVQYTNLGTIFCIIGIVFGLVTLIKPNLLLPLNKMWMRFGLLLGMIISPIVLGVLFFGMFTPMAIAMRLMGRDELRLKKQNIDSFWKKRKEDDQNNRSFVQQY
tara:strand:+ start:1787 stop:2188 length:402 start_codon:yes stop_codon:yes gene_type:complete